VRGVIAAIAPHDSVDRFEGLGVRVVKAAARFTGPREVRGGGMQVRARRIVIAAGSAAAIPDIPGIATAAPLTNETIFSLTALPEHLVIIGGGPIGVEMAQAFRRLGSRVTVLEARRILERDEPEFSEILRQRLTAEGIIIREGARIDAVTKTVNGIALTLSGGAEQITGTHLLVAAGRRPRLDGLDLEKAGVATTAKGITVDARLRTSNSRIYAIGDIAGGPQFTHIASYHAGLVIRNALFRLPAKADYRALPWVTYSDPELAHVGLTEAQARERHGNDVRIAHAAFDANDRARAERDTTGAIKVITRANGTVLGASILGRGAGELLPIWGMTIARRMKLSALTGIIFPYPTRSEIAKAAASAFYSPKLFSRGPKLLVRVLSRLG